MFHVSSELPVRPTPSALITQAFMHELFTSLGGVSLCGGQETTSVPLLSHRIDDYLVDSHHLVHDPRNVLELYERAEAFARDRRERGSILDTAASPGDATRAYWKNFLASAIARELDRAAAHVRYCRGYLYQPQLQGIVFFINQSVPLVEYTHLESVLAEAQTRHAGTIAMCLFHCRLPGGVDRLLQGFVPQDTDHAEFGTRLLGQFNRQLASS